MSITVRCLQTHGEISHPFFQETFHPADLLQGKKNKQNKTKAVLPSWEWQKGAGFGLLRVKPGLTRTEHPSSLDRSRKPSFKSKC